MIKKKMLIVGANSYIGKSLEAFAAGKYETKLVNSRDGAWQSESFAGYDALVHCAGIAHTKQRRRMAGLYYDVNCGLTVSVARKAKREGVGQFIFLSSMAVYGDAVPEISVSTPPSPAKGDLYGGSKLQAEQELAELAGDGFSLAIVRPPMVYGRGCPGNFQRLAKLAKLTPVFPDYANRRSIIYIDNLCAFLCGLVDGGGGGVYLPQNAGYAGTRELVKLIAACHGRRVIFTRLFNPLVRLLSKRAPVFGKLFGDLYYAQPDINNDAVEFEESVRRSVIY